MKHDGDTELLGVAIEGEEPIVVRIEMLVSRVEFEPSEPLLVDTTVEFLHGIECHERVYVGKGDEALAGFAESLNPFVRANTGHHGVVFGENDRIVHSLLVQETKEGFGCGEDLPEVGHNVLAMNRSGPVRKPFLVFFDPRYMKMEVYDWHLNISCPEKA